MRSYGCSRSEPEIARVYLSNNRSMFSLFRECRSLSTSYRYVHGVVICVDGPEKPSCAATRVRVMNIKDKCVLVLHWGSSQGGESNEALPGECLVADAQFCGCECLCSVIRVLNGTGDNQRGSSRLYPGARRGHRARAAARSRGSATFTVRTQAL